MKRESEDEMSGNIGSKDEDIAGSLEDLKQKEDELKSKIRKYLEVNNIDKMYKLLADLRETIRKRNELNKEYNFRGDEEKFNNIKTFLLQIVDRLTGIFA